MNNPEYDQRDVREERDVREQGDVRDMRDQREQRDMREQRDQTDMRNPRDVRDQYGRDQYDRDAQHDHPDMWAGMGDYRNRFGQLQMEFIEQPKETVSKAEALAKEAVERIVTSLHERLDHIHSEYGDGGDTEQMRVAMSHYREFMDSLSGRRAA